MEEMMNDTFRVRPSANVVFEVLSMYVVVIAQAAGWTWLSET
jgi:hypothetical protein